MAVTKTTKARKVAIARIVRTVYAIEDPKTKNTYIRTRDISDYLREKQPFAFDSLCKKRLMEAKIVRGAKKIKNGIISGNDAARIRQKTDNPRTLYISTEAIEYLLTHDCLSQKLSPRHKEILQGRIVNFNANKKQR